MDAQIRKDKNWVYKQIWGLQMSIDKQGVQILDMYRQVKTSMECIYNSQTSMDCMYIRQVLFIDKFIQYWSP